MPMSVDVNAAPGGLLAGLRVVGLEHSVAGPLCTRILGDLGAEVVKVERAPYGDFARHWDANVAGEGAQFWWLNRRKRSIVLDLKQEGGRTAFDALLGRADVFVSNLSPGATERLGLTPELFDERFPELVVCQISGYGRTGAFRDRKAYDMLVQAEAGVMSLTGSPEQPSRTGVSIVDVGTGIYAAALVLAGLLGKTQSGRGCFLDVAMFDAVLEFAGPMLLSYVNAGVLYPRVPQRHHAIAPYGVFRCADGTQVLFAVEHDAEWRRFADAVLERPDLADDPRFATNVARLAHREEVDSLVGDAVARLDAADAVAMFDDLGLAYASLNDMRDVSEHPVAAERRLFDAADTATGAAVITLVGLAERLGATSLNGRARPPALGEDTEAILSELDLGMASLTGEAS